MTRSSKGRSAQILFVPTGGGLQFGRVEKEEKFGKGTTWEYCLGKAEGGKERGKIQMGERKGKNLKKTENEKEACKYSYDCLWCLD